MQQRNQSDTAILLIVMALPLACAASYMIPYLLEQNDILPATSVGFMLVIWPLVIGISFVTVFAGVWHISKWVANRGKKKKRKRS